SVKDHLAGKRAACPACHKPLQIPAPTAAPANVEDLAASVLANEPEPAEAAAPKTVDFHCPQCDAELHLPAELSGKQSQCPECRRIIKVPVLATTDPKDWRRAKPALPSGARQNVEQQAPEGTWGSATSTLVSHDSLLDADAIPSARERLTLAQKLKWTALG